MCSSRHAGRVTRHAAHSIPTCSLHAPACCTWAHPNPNPNPTPNPTPNQVGYDRVALEGTAATAAKLWREEGVRGFYRGLGTALVRSTPQASLTLIAYEHLLGLFSTGRMLNVAAPG